MQAAITQARGRDCCGKRSSSIVGMSFMSDTPPPLPKPDENGPTHASESEVSSMTWAEYEARKRSEYRRTCQRCGKIWHSLVSREDALIRSHKNSRLGGRTTRRCGDPPSLEATLQAQRNRDASKTDLAKLRQCPDCSSSDCQEEVIELNKQA